MNKAIEAFRKKYGDMDIYPPEDIGRAVFASIVYERLQLDAQREEGAQKKGIEDLFTQQQRDTLTATITTPEEWQRYLAYRQLEEWLKSRSVEAVMILSLANATGDAIRTRLCTITWAEEAEKEIGGNVQNNIFMHKLDAAMFAFDDHIEINSLVERDNLQYALNRLHIYNTQLELVAKELRMPELVACYAIDIKDKVTSNIEWINGLIEQLYKDISANYEDDSGIGTIKRNAFIAHLRPYQTEPDEIPAAQLRAAKAQLKGLAIFYKPLGGTTFDRLFRLKPKNTNL